MVDDVTMFTQFSTASSSEYDRQQQNTGIKAGRQCMHILQSKFKPYCHDETSEESIFAAENIVDTTKILAGKWQPS